MSKALEISKTPPKEEDANRRSISCWANLSVCEDLAFQIQVRLGEIKDHSSRRQVAAPLFGEFVHERLLPIVARDEASFEQLFHQPGGMLPRLFYERLDFHGGPGSLQEKLQHDALRRKKLGPRFQGRFRRGNLFHLLFFSFGESLCFGF